MAVELAKILGSDRVQFVWVGISDEPEGRQFRHLTRAHRFLAAFCLAEESVETQKHWRWRGQAEG